MIYASVKYYDSVRRQLCLIMEHKIVQEFDLTFSWSTEGVYVYKNKNLLIQFIYPHEGTKFKYCLRADFPETFDRWSVCLFEEDFVAEESDSVFEKLKDFVKNKKEMIS